jgi:hypothetical protein
MGWNDRIDEDEEERRDFLQELVDGGYLDGAAVGITKLVIDKGDRALSDKQKFVFKREVLDVYVTGKCKRDGTYILWTEMLAAYENGGLCGYCLHMDDKHVDE